MQGTRKLKSVRWVVLVLPIFFCGVLFIADKTWPLTLPEEQTSFATVVLDRHGQPLRNFADNKGIWRHYVTLEQVSPRYLQALLNYEDRFFYQHPGVNPLSLIRAALQYVQHGRIVSGGSTLTMQVARILHPHSRSFSGKFSQILRALQLEWHLSKTQILELYVNHAPFGGTLEGIQAASYQYLRKPANHLRDSEAALLAVLPQAPSRLRPDRHPQRAELARNKVLDRLVEHGIWTQPAVDNAKQERVRAWQPRSPLHAPILARRLHQRRPNLRVLHTSIDLNQQRMVADYVKNYVRARGEQLSAAVLVVDNNDQAVRVYAGSADFLDRRRAGHVDMVSAIRSPGSTLKPFLYGLALDAELIHSESLLADVPRLSHHYRPGNFSRGFSGPVSASEALQRSLNLPFVQLIEAYGEQAFVNRLDHVGQALKIPGGKASAAVILGGAGTSLERLVTLYSSLANQGYVRPLRYMANMRESAGRQLMSEEAAWITWNTLRGVQLPRAFRLGLSRERLAAIGWKTGTSWDHRDVWAIGVSEHYTIGVWLGRPDGKPMDKAAMGVTLAGPLLFNLFSQMDYHTKPFPQPENIKQLSICWPDGRSELLVEYCGEQRMAFTKNEVTPRTLERSQNRMFFNPLTSVLTDANTGLRVDRECFDGMTEAKEFSLWPVALEPWLPQSQRRAALLPPYKSDCLNKQFYRRSLRIVGINPDQVYHLTQGETAELPVRVEGMSGRSVWYLNGKKIAENTHRIRLKLDKGSLRKNELFVLDESGAQGRLVFTIL